MQININKRHFVIFLDNCTHKSTKPRKADSKASAKWKEVKGKPDKITELILKRKGDMKKGPLDYVFFELIGYHLERGYVRLKLNVQGQGGGII